VYPKINMIQINVLDPDKSAKFYIEVLGFQLDKSKSIPGVPVLKSNQNICIILYLAIEKNLRNYPRDTGPLIVFEVEDIAKTKQEWEAKGVEFLPNQWAEPTTGIALCPFGQYVAFKDLDGNIHEVLQPHPVKEQE